jgi:ComF family protein
MADTSPLPRRRSVGRAGTLSGWRGLRQPCVLCGGWGRQGLCADCLARFVDPRPPRCPRCALPTPGGAVCGGCLRAPPVYRGCIAAVDYGYPWDRLITRFKFQDHPELAGLLAEVLQTAVRQAGPPEVDCVLPVPLGAARLAERGYNQAWELARRIASALGLPAEADALQRLRDTPHQVGLARAERERNLRDAIWLPPGAAARLTGRNVALVDDVMTTGVTAAASTRALLAAGVAGVQVWVLARTPAPD